MAELTPAERMWKEQIGDATAHMIKGVTKTTMTTKCGLTINQDKRNVGTIWHTRVNCRKCLAAMGPGSPGEVIYLDDDEIEW